VGTLFVLTRVFRNIPWIPGSASRPRNDDVVAEDGEKFMETLPNTWLALLLTVFALGMRHGMDPDHLATIDGLTRFNAAERPRLARWSGFLFSLGHGLVVMAVAVAVGVAAQGWQAPAWLEGLGAWISILFLAVLGWVNLAAVLRAPADQVVPLVGIKGRWLGMFTHASHPLLVAGVGALFALSFDTLSQAALFSVAASAMSGWLFAAALGLAFMLGMMATDAANGLWIARLIRRTDRRAAIASRVMGLTVAGLSLLVAGFGLAKLLAPQLAAVTDGLELAFGAAVVATVAASYIVALKLSPQPG
jgi:high-affinity nickel-transport protein